MLFHYIILQKDKVLYSLIAGLVAGGIEATITVCNLSIATKLLLL